MIKNEFGNKVQIDLIERNLKTKKYEITFNIDMIDRYLPKKYSKEELEKLIWHTYFQQLKDFSHDELLILEKTQCTTFFSIRALETVKKSIQKH